jgi:hypothetical protein
MAVLWIRLTKFSMIIIIITIVNMLERHVRMSPIMVPYYENVTTFAT